MSSLPYFVHITGPKLVRPPFNYSGVVTRVFPLQADMGRLQEFCDQYLNLNTEKAHFEPMVPYVDLIILTYDEMTSVEDGAAACFSQHEILFQISLLWTDVQSGRKRTAVVAPYIYVDNSVSATTGRESYGWPKVRAVIRPQVPTWAADPTAPESLIDVTVTTATPQGLRPNTLLSIQSRELQLSLDTSRPLRAGLELKNPPPWFGLWTGMKAMSDLWDRNLNLGVQLTRELLYGVAGLKDRSMSPWLMGTNVKGILLVNCVNLKQFPDAVQPSKACYQGLTNTPIEVIQVKRLGLIGARRQALLDPSGGCTIRMSDLPQFPIVRKLGLVVASQETLAPNAKYSVQGSRASEQSVQRIFNLKPVCPYWLEADLRQLPSETIYRVWSHGSRQDREGTPESAEPKRVELPAYNGAMGARAAMAPGSPVTFDDMEVRYVNLMADRDSLRRRVQELGYIEPTLNIRLADNDRASDASEARSRVHLMVTSLKSMTANHVKFPWFRMTEVGFYIPIVYTPKDTDAPIRALYPLISFTDNASSLHVFRETYGGNMLLADIEPGEDPWLRTSGRAGPMRELMKVRTLTVQKYGAGLDAEKKTLMQLYAMDKGPPLTVAHDKKLSDHPFAELLLEGELTAKTGRAARKVRQEQKLNILRLKQFPDAENPTEAVIQQLVLTSSRLCSWDSRLGSSLLGMLRATPEAMGGGAEEETRLVLFDSQNYPLGESLGLQVATPSRVAFGGTSSGGVPVHEYCAENGSRWFRAAVEQTSQVLSSYAKSGA